MQKEEWSEWDKRHRRQSCEGSSERVRATSEFQKICAIGRRPSRFGLCACFRRSQRRQRNSRADPNLGTLKKEVVALLANWHNCAAGRKYSRKGDQYEKK